jgi:hypothetical protein
MKKPKLLQEAAAIAERLDKFFSVLSARSCSTPFRILHFAFLISPSLPPEPEPLSPAFPDNHGFGSAAFCILHFAFLISPRSYAPRR